jgi:hypothetical protein
MRATVTTAGSNTSTALVTSTCSACTISQAIGTGSSDRYGAEAWPLRPRTTISMRSPEAMVGPARRLSVPDSYCVLMCSAKAAPTGAAPSPDWSSSPSSLTSTVINGSYRWASSFTTRSSMNASRASGAAPATAMPTR